MGLCLTGAQFSMWADVRRQYPVDDPDTTDDNGEWVIIQDPDSGAITRVWRSYDNPDTPEDESVTGETFPCMARGVISQGIRTQSTTQDWTQVYRATDIIQLEFPTDVVLRRNDHVTNIRDAKGNLIWREEESVDSPATVFVVNGVVPMIGPFNQHIKNFALLERVDNQDDQG